MEENKIDYKLYCEENKIYYKLYCDNVILYRNNITQLKEKCELILKKLDLEIASMSFNYLFECNKKIERLLNVKL